MLIYGCSSRSQESTQQAKTAANLRLNRSCKQSLGISSVPHHNNKGSFLINSSPDFLLSSFLRQTPRPTRQLLHTNQRPATSNSDSDKPVSQPRSHCTISLPPPPIPINDHAIKNTLAPPPRPLAPLPPHARRLKNLPNNNAPARNALDRAPHARTEARRRVQRRVRSLSQLSPLTNFSTFGTDTSAPPPGVSCVELVSAGGV